MTLPVGRIRVDGARELRTTLKAAGRDMGELKGVHKRVAGIVLDAARPDTPVGPAPYHVKETLRASGTQSDAVIRAGKAKHGTYAKSVHYGYKKKLKGGKTLLIKANPWIRNAARRTRPRWFAVYEQHVGKILDSIEGTRSP